mmetsp:Transcript_6499/g.8441  ORF Transcript_6499/g.8441 Transcript_6499/m.8441 type:complete len:194 (+) Transcript_6499:1-582(+)
MSPDINQNHHGNSTNVGVLHSGNHAGKDVLLQKIGGKQVLHQAVDTFYDRLTKDPVIQPFFRSADVQVLKWHQYNLMSIAFHDVPANLDVVSLILEKHKNMFDSGLNEKTYDVVLGHFVETLQGLDVPDDTVAEALTIVRPLRDIFEQGAREATERRKHIKNKQTIVQMIAVGGTAALCAYVGLNYRRSRKTF